MLNINFEFILFKNAQIAGKSSRVKNIWSSIKFVKMNDLKPKRAQYSTAELQLAIESVNSGESVSSVAARTRIPISTIHRKVSEGDKGEFRFKSFRTQHL